MTFVGDRLFLRDDTAGDTWVTGDIARANPDVVVVGWSYWSDKLYFQAVRMSVRELGPLLTVAMEGPIYAMVETDDDSGIWMLVGDSENNSYLRLAKVTVSEALVVTVAWKADMEIRYFYGAWLKVWGDRIIVGTNCGNLNDPADPDAYQDSQFYMFDLNGTLLDKKPAPLDPYVYNGITYNYTFWLDTVALNPYTNELMAVWNDYDAGYKTFMATMPLSASSFGSWTTSANRLYNDYPRWITAVGTPAGWHILSCPNGPRYAEIIVLNLDLTRRWAQLITPWDYNTGTWYDDELAKVYDIAHDPTTETVSYSAMRWYSGLAYARSGVDANATVQSTMYLPKTEDIDWESLMRITHLGDGRTAYLGAGAGGLAGGETPWIAVWLLAEDEADLPPSLNAQSEGRSNFRRMR